MIASYAETERLSRELDSLRSRALQEDAQQSLARERELRELQGELERCKLDRDEWERVALQERAVADDAKSSTEILRRDLELEVAARERVGVELETEQEKSTNLLSVLQDFQSCMLVSRLCSVKLISIFFSEGPRITAGRRGLSNANESGNRSIGRIQASRFDS